LNQDERPLVRVYLDRRAALVRYFAMRLGSPAAAEDLVQDMYVKISERPDLGDQVHNPAAFLYRLGTNLMLDRMKQERRSRARDHAWREADVTSIGAEDIADLPAADAAVAAKQRLAAIVVALNDLPPACRRAFRLHKLEGLSHAETAQAMGISRSGVEKHVSAAVRHLMKVLD